jgi:glycine amidinotransferase/scyllo-inosamine-4-phosphate amidinotransferase 1
MISTYNEWDPLRRVVVGRADHANWPKYDPVFAKESEKTTWTETPVPRGPVPQHIIDEANEDLEILADTLRTAGAEVLRPNDLNFQSHDGLYNYCPRDRLLIHGSVVIDPPMMYPCRDMEIQCYQDILKDVEVVRMPRNRNIVLDAANVLRLNDDMLFLESPSGNHEALEWMLDIMVTVNIEKCNFYSGVHIDSTIVPLREGLVALNASRVTPEICPKVFKNWDKIWVTDVVAQGFHEYPYASKWIAMNMLVINPQTVIVDRHQTELIKTLESHNMTVVPLELRHSRTLGGGFHCVTLDLHRG